MFRTVFPSIIRSSRLYIQQQAYVRYCRLLASGNEMFHLVPASKQDMLFRYFFKDFDVVPVSLCNRYHVFKRVRKIAKSNYWLRHGCPSVRPCIATRLPLDGFSLYLKFEDFFREPVAKIQISLKSYKRNGYFT